jgi:hypothetical protein
MRLRIFYSPEGFGNVGYDFPAANAANVLDAANDGLSTDAATSKIAQLGQTVGRALDPAKLLEVREIPLNGFSILLNGVTAANAALIIKQLVSLTNSPQLIFQNAAGTEISRICFPDNQGILIGALAGAANNASGKTVVLIGNSAGHDLTTSNIIIAIGSGALQGSGAINPNSIIGIGQDCIDRSGGAIADHIINLGHNSLSSGNPVFTLGTNIINIGNRNGSGANAGSIGAEVTVIGHRSNVGGGLTNTIVIANFNNGVNLLTLSNVVVIAKSDQNVLIGQVVAAWTDNGNRLQVNGNGFFAGGLAPKIRTTTTLAETFGALDNTILCDATAGNLVVTIDPTLTTQRIGNVKKIDSSVNTVTLTAASGLIFDIGAGVASLSVGVQGENLQFQSDGTNIYIL